MMTSMKRLSAGTIEHASDMPADDRPDYLDGMYLVAADTETTGLEWDSTDTPFLATMSDYDRDWLYYLPGDDAVMLEMVDDGTHQFRESLLTADGIIFHNASFDIHMMVRAGVVTLDEILSKEIHDTDLLARIVLGGGNSQHHAGGFGLKNLAKQYLDADAGDEQDAVHECMESMKLIRKAGQKSIPPGAFKQVWHAYPDVLEQYAIKDTRYTYDLFYTLMDMATEDDMLVYEMERTLLPVVVRMEHTGTALDRPRVDELHEAYTERQKQQEAVLYEFNGDEPFNPDSPNDLLPILEAHGVTLEEKTASGQPRMDKWILERHSNVPVVKAVLDYRTTSKFLSTYLDVMKDRDTVHPNFWQIGAWTGRMSCSRPNMQNIPVRTGPEARSMFVPRPKKALIVADYSSIELRLLAYFMADDDLWEIIKNGDPFLWLGAQVYGHSDQDAWPVKRQPLKNGFYALTYGAGGPKLAQTIGGGMTVAEGRALAKSIRNALGPNYRLLTQRIEARVRTRGYVKTILGRTQRIPRDKSYVGLNALIQGSAADLMKVALIRSADALKDVHGYPLLTVHDEVVAEVPQEQADEGLAILTATMESVSDMAAAPLHLKVEGKVCFDSYAEAK